MRSGYKSMGYAAAVALGMLAVSPVHAAEQGIESKVIEKNLVVPNAREVAKAVVTNAWQINKTPKGYLYSIIAGCADHEDYNMALSLRTTSDYGFVGDGPLIATVNYRGSGRPPIIAQRIEIDTSTNKIKKAYTGENADEDIAAKLIKSLMNNQCIFLNKKPMAKLKEEMFPDYPDGL